MGGFSYSSTWLGLVPGLIPKGRFTSTKYQTSDSSNMNKYQSPSIFQFTSLSILCFTRERKNYSSSISLLFSWITLTPLLLLSYPFGFFFFLVLFRSATFRFVSFRFVLFYLAMLVLPKHRNKPNAKASIIYFVCECVCMGWAGFRGNQ